MKASIIIPVLNEYDNLKKLLPRLLDSNVEILVCDNGSTDGSVKLVEDAGVNFNIRLSKGTGSVTSAILRGIKEARSDRVVIMDGDGSHSPEVALKMASLLSECDMVIGRRAASKDSLRNRIVSWGYNLLTYFLASGVKDRSSGFWGIRKYLTSTKIRDTVKPMLEYLVKSNPVSVVEVPYTFQPRLSGESKLGKPILKTLVDIALLYLYKYSTAVKYLVVGGLFTVVVFLGTFLITEIAGIWYMASLAIMVAVIEVAKFLTLGSWVFGEKTQDSRGSSYEWFSWYKGNLLQKYWKRKIGSLTKQFLGDPRKVLDVGSGSSPAINLFRCEKWAVDGSREKLDFLSKYSSLAGTLQCNLEFGLPLTGNYDAVICNNVLEHLQHPEEVVEGISRNLSMGGRVVLTVPNVSNPFTGVVEWVYGKVMPNGYADEHCFQFTPKSLEELCSRHSLKLVDRKSVFTDMVCLYQKV